MAYITVLTRTRGTIELCNSGRVFKKFLPIYYGTRIGSEKGQGTALGVDKKGCLWFLLDDDINQDRGASHWEKFHCIEDAPQLEITIIKTTPQQRAENISKISKIILKAIDDDIKSLQTMIVDSLKEKPQQKNSDIVKKIPKIGEKIFLTNNFFKTSYQTLKEKYGLTKKDAPKLFKKLKTRIKEEAIYTMVVKEHAEREKQYLAIINALRENAATSQPHTKKCL